MAFVFASDNGPLNGTHQGLAGTDCRFLNSAGGLRDGKGSLGEGGIREPTTVRWPGKIKARSRSERASGFEDWLPTLLEIAGASDAMSQDVDGISLAPTLFGERQAERPFLYREFPGYLGFQAVRIGDWNGIRQNLLPKAAGAKPAMSIGLGNLRTDPAETTDVADKHPDIIARIEYLMREQHVPSKEFPFPALDR